MSSDAVRSIGSSTVHFKFSLILPPEALATFEKETWVGDRRETLLLSRSFLGAWGYIADQSFAVLFAAAVSGTAHCSLLTSSPHHCTTAPLHHRTTAPPHYCITAPLHHFITAHVPCLRPIPERYP